MKVTRMWRRSLINSKVSSMKKELRKKQPKSSPGKWDSTSAPRWTEKKHRMFWDWIIEGRDFPKRDFLRDLKRVNDPRYALARLVAKMKKSETARLKKLKEFAMMYKSEGMRRKKLHSGKWGRTH